MDRKHGEAERGWLDERYCQVIEQVEDYAIFTLDEAGRVSTWNRGAERVLGYFEEEALGEPGALIFSLRPRTASGARPNTSSPPPGARAKRRTCAGTCAKTASAFGQAAC